MNFRRDHSISEDVLSIEYVPKTGKNKGKIYEQFYKNDVCNLFVWLRDTAEIIDDELYKRDLQGTYWDMNPWMKNVAKEGNVDFPNGKKPEQLVYQIINMATEKNDLVLDSFLGSGTTASVAHKMGRKYIGIEMGDQCYTHCKARLDRVIDGEQGGISRDLEWNGGGGYDFYEVAPTLLKEDAIGELVINKEYDADKLAAAVALHEGYTYEPDQIIFWKQSRGTEHSFLYVTTKHVSAAYLENIQQMMSENEFLIVACKSFDDGADKNTSHIKVKKIPQMLLGNCEFGHDDYSLNIIHPPKYEDESEEDEDDC